MKPFENLRDRARDWFDRNRDELKKRVCGHPAWLYAIAVEATGLDPFGG